MSLQDYAVKRDKFELDKKLKRKVRSCLIFPCCVCKNGLVPSDLFPCCVCDHNPTAVKEEPPKNDGLRELDAETGFDLLAHVPSWNVTRPTATASQFDGIEWNPDWLSGLEEAIRAVVRDEWEKAQEERV